MVLSRQPNELGPDGPLPAAAATRSPAVLIPLCPDSARSYLAATVAGGGIYALGGFEGTQGNRYLATVERYSPVTASHIPVLCAQRCCDVETTRSGRAGGWGVG